MRVATIVRHRPVLAALALALGAASCGAPPEAPTAAPAGAPAVPHSFSFPEIRLRDPGSRRMADRLREIAARANPMTNAYVNAARAAALPPPPAGANPLLVQRMSRDRARELLRAGRTEEAIEVFAGLLAEVPAGPSGLRQRQTLRSWLGLAYLRLGEQENCLLRHGIESCLLPIRGSGVHQAQRGSRAAIERFTEILREESSEGLVLRTVWLLNIAYMTVGEYPDGVPEAWRIPPEAFASDHDIGRFEDVASRLGLDVTGLSGGAVMEDLDGDGDLDLFMTSWALDAQMRLFANNGDGTFTDRTAAADLAGLTGGLNVVTADYDNDGHVDLLVLRGAWLSGDWQQPNSLLHNNGDGTFSDVTEAAGLLDYHATQTAAWGDYDGDGRVDLYVGNESPRPDVRAPCQLFHNNGDGTFTDVAHETGTDLVGYVKGVVWGDYDDDGRPDLYLSVLGGSNVLYHNRGPDGSGAFHFENVTETAGVGGPRQSFPTWFWDYDNDGRLDLWVSGYGPSREGAASEVAAESLGRPVKADLPRLYHNNGDGTFTDLAPAVGLDTVLYTMGSNFGDLDNDGFLDFYAGTGTPDLGSLVPNRMFRNDGGRRFQDVTTSGGFGHLQKGHGVAFGDLDNDGDQDVFAVIGGAFSGDVYQNVLFENPGHGNRWVGLRLEGTRSNRAAIGARIEVVVEDERGATRSIHALVSSGGSFGASSFGQQIGLGRARRIVRARVSWPATGQVQTVEGLTPDTWWRVREGDDAPEEHRRTAFQFAGAGADAPHAGHRHPAGD